MEIETLLSPCPTLDFTNNTLPFNAHTHESATSNVLPSVQRCCLELECFQQCAKELVLDSQTYPQIRDDFKLHTAAESLLMLASQALKMKDCQQTTTLQCKDTSTRTLSPTINSSFRSLRRRRKNLNSALIHVVLSKLAKLNTRRTNKRTFKFSKSHMHFESNDFGPKVATTHEQLRDGIFKLFANNEEEATRICNIVFSEMQNPVNTQTITPIATDKQLEDEECSKAVFPELDTPGRICSESEMPSGHVPFRKQYLHIRTESCSGMIKDLPVGCTFVDRLQLGKCGMHTQYQASFQCKNNLVNSVLLDGKNDGKDLGDVVFICGVGGCNNKGEPVAHHKWVRGNSIMLQNIQQGVEVRLIRGNKMNSEYAPSSVRYRYDGLYLPVGFTFVNTVDDLRWIYFILVRKPNQTPLKERCATAPRVVNLNPPVCWTGKMCHRCLCWDEMYSYNYNCCRCGSGQQSDHEFMIGSNKPVTTEEYHQLGVMKFELEEDTGRLVYHPKFIKYELADCLLQKLVNTLPWEMLRIQVSGSQHYERRWSCFFGDCGVEYAYASSKRKRHDWNDTLLEIKQMVETETGQKFNSCLVNLYTSGYHCIRWHADDEQCLGKEPLIASVSLGDTRDFTLRMTDNPKISHTFSLTHGSMLVMGGATQLYWQHSIAETDRVTGPRVNLTFRQIEVMV